MGKKKEIVTFIGRHGIKYPRYEDQPLLTCKFVIDTTSDTPSRFGFGDIHHFNEKAEIYTIIDDGGEIWQRTPDYVTIAGSGKVNK